MKHDPELAAAMKLFKLRNRALMNTFEPELGCVVCRAALDDEGVCPSDAEHQEELDGLEGR